MIYAYRAARERKASFVGVSCLRAYGNGKDGTFSLADARRERDKAKDLLKERQ